MVAGDRAMLIIIPDLLFQSRLREQAAALGYRVAIADTDAAVIEGLAGPPHLAVIDLHAAGIDWQAAVGAAVEAGVPVLAFGRHTEAALLAAARDAGCARVVPRSQLVEDLAALITETARA